MKANPVLLLVAAVLLPAVSFAAKNAKRPKSAPARHDGVMAEVMKTFDKNENHQIDADELPALQKAFSTLKNLDKNGNGEIELTEVESLKPQAASGDRKGRMLAGLKQMDQNGNHKIDADEVEALQKMIAGGKIMSRLDHNGNGKLDPDEVERLNKHLEHGLGKSDAATTPAPSVRQAPEKPAESNPPEAPKPEEKKEKPADPATKPPGNFGA